MERVPTGIDELDVKLSGSYPKGKGLLVTGVSGSGKTIFGLHLLHRSCVGGMNCVLIATEETPEDLLMQAEMLELDLAECYDSRQLIIGRVFESRLSKSVQVTKYGFAQGRARDRTLPAYQLRARQYWCRGHRQYRGLRAPLNFPGFQGPARCAEFRAQQEGLHHHVRHGRVRIHQ